MANIYGKKCVTIPLKYWEPKHSIPARKGKAGIERFSLKLNSCSGKEDPVWQVFMTT
jgi:hypothetical protein